MSTNHSLENKVALITSSSPGTCADMAKQLASAGAKVVVCGRDANQGLATVRQIRNSGGRATFVLADIAVIADIRAMIDETIATYGRLDILLNSVSNSYAQDAPVLDVSESVWDRIIEPLLKGTFFCCQQSLPFLQQYDGGTIINLIEKTPGLQGRSVSKICQGGVVAMTSAITQQFNSSNVTANLVWATPLTTQTAEPEIGGDETQMQLLARKVITRPPNTEQADTEQSGTEQASAEQANTEQSSTEASGTGQPFSSIGEAVMYLAQHGRSLHGTALWVHTSAPSTLQSTPTQSSATQSSGSDSNASSSESSSSTKS